jgi:hypothetical protein
MHVYERNEVKDTGEHKSKIYNLYYSLNIVTMIKSRLRHLARMGYYYLMTVSIQRSTLFHGMY